MAKKDRFSVHTVSGLKVKSKIEKAKKTLGINETKPSTDK
jgi:hypothetical protein